MINGSVKKSSLTKDILFGWANLIFAEILCLLVNLFTAIFMSTNLSKGIVGLFTMAILICIVGNYAYNRAKNDKACERTFKIKHKSYKHILLGFVISLPLIIQWIALLICRISNNDIGDKLFVVYRLINAYYLPWINIFCATPNLSELSYMGLVTILAFTIIPGIAFSFVYIVTYNNIDIEKILIYNKE